MALFGIYRVVDVQSKTTPGKSTPMLHVENPATGKTFCGKNPQTISQKLFIPAWDCKTCYDKAVKKARPLLLNIKVEQ